MLKIFLLLLFCGLVHAETLSGRVTSAEEGAMEGVLVSAKQTGSSVTISVVSDAQGRYGFPASRLQAGTYSLGIRAVGYELSGPVTIAIAPEQSASVDLRLRKTADLAAQLLFFMIRPPPTSTLFHYTTLLNCVACHTLE